MKKMRKYRKPVIRINPELDKYNDVILFPEKFAIANEQLKNAEDPEEFIKRHRLRMNEVNKPRKKTKLGDLFLRRKK